MMICRLRKFYNNIGYITINKSFLKIIVIYFKNGTGIAVFMFCTKGPFVAVILFGEHTCSAPTCTLQNIGVTV